MTNDPNEADLEPVADDTEDFSEFEDHDLDFEDDTQEPEEAEIEDDASDDEEQPDETEEEAEEAEAEDEADSEDDAVLVAMDDGEQLTLTEIKAGYLRNQDYTHKTTEVAGLRKEADASIARSEERWKVAENTVQGLVQYIQGIIPPEPPLSLAHEDPGAYTAQQAVRAGAVQEFQQLLSASESIQNHSQEMSAEDMRAHKEKADAELVKSMPHLSEPSRRAAFDNANKKTAMEFGFSEQEITSTVDPRLLKMVHYARIGQMAEHNRNNAKRRTETPKAAKAKVSKAPIPQTRQRKAMDRLSKSGSLEDAMSVDFE